jgi:hypothetical protein
MSSRAPAVAAVLLALLASGAPIAAEPRYELSAVARTGDAAPGGGTFDRFGQETLPIVAPVNAAGDVVFFATVVRGGADEGIFLRRGGRVVAVAREGDRVPGVGRLAGFGKHPTPALSDAGSVAFVAAVAGGRAVEGVFTWSAGRVRAIATTGSPAPGMPTSVLAGVDTPGINARGDVVFLATIRRGRESIEAILASSGGVLRKVVAQGDPAPAGGAFAAFGPPALNADGRVAFAAVVEGKAVPGGIFVAKGDRVEMVVGAGEESPLGGIFAKFSERVGLNDQGVIAFHGMLKFAPVEAAIFSTEGGRVRAVSRLGDPARRRRSLRRVARRSRHAGGHPPGGRRRTRAGRRGRGGAARRRSHRDADPLPGGERGPPRTRHLRGGSDQHRPGAGGPVRRGTASDVPLTGTHLSSCRRADTR